jgi:hypothetical protein
MSKINLRRVIKPRTNIEKDGKGDILADPHKIVNRWMNYFCQILNVQRVGGIRQTEMQTAEPFVPEPSNSEVEVAIGKLKRCKSPGADQIPADLSQAGRKHYILRSTNLLSRFRTKKNCPTNGRNQLSYQQLSVVIIGTYYCCQLHATIYPTVFSVG